MAKEIDEKIILKDSCSEKSCSDYDFGEFPAGLRVLLVEDDRTCLLVSVTMLRKLLYQVTACYRAKDALTLLREDKNRFDIIISNLRMPEVDGFKLLEIVQLESIDLPVVMMSAEDGKEFVLKGIKNGACDYLLKPVRIENFKVIWQHVVRKKKIGFKELGQPISSVEDGELQLKQSSSSNIVFPQNVPGNQKTFKRRKDLDDEDESLDDATTAKKPRITWTKELHQKFVTAVNQLGRDKAVPKKILERMKEMNVSGLTRENVASHLQKYRLYLQRLTEASYDIGHSHPYMEPKRSIFEQSASLDATSGQLAGPSLATPETSGFERLLANSNSRVGMQLADQWNLFESRIPESRFYPAIDHMSTHDYPLASSVALAPSCKSLFSPREEYEYMYLENTAQHSRNLSVGNSNEFPGVNMCEFISDQPLLYVKYGDDEGETLRGPFV